MKPRGLYGALDEVDNDDDDDNNDDDDDMTAEYKATKSDCAIMSIPIRRSGEFDDFKN